jgi:methyl-accepting chemotaxis protein
LSIKQRLVVAFATMACVPVLLIAVWVIFDQRQQAKDIFIDISGREIRQVDSAMQLFFDGVSQNVSYLANLESVRTADGRLKSYLGSAPELLPPSERGEFLSKIFTEFAHTHPDYAFVTLGTSDGGVAFWPDSLLKDYDPRVRPWYETALANPGKAVRTEAYEWEEGNIALVGTVQAVVNPEGKVSGVLDIDVSLKQLTDLVHKIKIGSTGYLMLLERDGTVLADASATEHSFKSLTDLGTEYAPLEAVSDGYIELELGGKAYMANVVSSSGLGWRFVGLIEKEEVLAGAQRLAWHLSLVATLLVIGFAILGATLARRIVEPIQGVILGLEGIANGEGDLTRSLQCDGKDETAILARWFNTFLETIRQFVVRITGASAVLNETSSKMMRFATDMNDAAQRQRESLELVSTAFNEMVATANDVAKSCASAVNSADVGQEQVVDGQRQITDAAVSVDQLSVSLGQAAKALELLKQDSQNINAILDTIRSIADQTNLLALNAAIEAARAGEQGRGFSVVADEVRALARRTADSTGQIGEVLGGLVERTSRVAGQMQESLLLSQGSVDSIESARASFQSIQTSVDDIRDKNVQIATAAEEQHQVSEEINRHIAGVLGDALQVVDFAQRSHSESRQLTNVSGELQALIGRYRT